MRIDQFIEECGKQWRSFPDSQSLGREPHPTSRDLQHISQMIEGMATENKLKLLNIAARFLEPDEVYVEIGCWKGLTLAGASHGNADVPVFACDNFSQFGGPRDSLHDTIRTHCNPERVQFFDMNYADFLGKAPWSPRKVGVYFYDGGHSFQEQYNALKWIWPSLADRAIVIVDDTNEFYIRSANRLALRGIPGVKVLCSIHTGRNASPTWWNGVEVFSICKSNGSFSPKFRDRRARVFHLLWDKILLPLRATIEDSWGLLRRRLRKGAVP